MFEIEYLMKRDGQPKAVVIPIELWEKLLPKEDRSFNDLSEALEDYCLNRAMNEGRKTSLLNRDEALAYLEEQTDAPAQKRKTPGTLYD
ncbi:hypothetical protein QUF72_04815 [Desulfobacterales bacterium HSG2]|nr:hypothetical protein [Desulfobacterales bacterium HSG2]